jgi:ribose 1,5-bisphosphokinase PhnN
MTRKILRVNGVDVRSREFRVSQAVASARLEGRELSPRVLELFKRYARNELDYEEVITLVNSGEFDKPHNDETSRRG